MMHNKKTQLTVEKCINKFTDELQKNNLTHSEMCIVTKTCLSIIEAGLECTLMNMENKNENN
jgi:hypothetical protein